MWPALEVCELKIDHTTTINPHSDEPEACKVQWVDIKKYTQIFKNPIKYIFIFTN